MYMLLNQTIKIEGTPILKLAMVKRFKEYVPKVNGSLNSSSPQIVPPAFPQKVPIE